MTKYDYEALYDEFYRDKAKTGMTQYAFAESKGIHPKQLCRAFGQIKREIQMQAFKHKNPRLLLKAQRNLEKALDDPEADPRLSLEAYKAVSDREGLSPNAVNVAIQNNMTTIIKVQPILAASEDDTLRHMFKADEPPKMEEPE